MRRHESPAPILHRIDAGEGSDEGKEKAQTSVRIGFLKREAEILHANMQELQQQLAGMAGTSSSDRKNRSEEESRTSIEVIQQRVLNDLQKSRSRSR